MKWIRRPPTAMPRPIPLEEYEERRNPGLQISLDKGMPPFKLFIFIVTVGFVSNIVTWTNIHAGVKRLGGDRGPWKETNIGGIFAFLVYFMIMNDFVCLPSPHSYFMTDQRQQYLLHFKIREIKIPDTKIQEIMMREIKIPDIKIQ